MAWAATISAAAEPQQLAPHERVDRRLDHGDHETSEGVTDRHEAADVAAVWQGLDSPCPDRTAEDPIDLLESRFAGAFPLIGAPAFGEDAQRGANASGLDERRRRAGGLGEGASDQCRCPLGVDDTRRLEPSDIALEGVDRVHAHAETRVVGVHEVEPEPSTDEDEGGVLWTPGRRHHAKIARGR